MGRKSLILAIALAGTMMLGGTSRRSGSAAFSEIQDDLPCSALEYPRRNAGDNGWECAAGAVGGDALTSTGLGQFATTTADALATVLLGQTTGTGSFVRAISPTFSGSPYMSTMTAASMNGHGLAAGTDTICTLDATQTLTGKTLTAADNVIEADTVLDYSNMTNDLECAGLACDIADNAVDGTDISIAGQAPGSLLYADASGNWVPLGIGTPGQYIWATAGGLPAWSTVVPGAESNDLTVSTNGIAVDQVPVGTAAGNASDYLTLPDCNASNEALNYDTATHAWSCRTVAGGGTGHTIEDEGSSASLPPRSILNFVGGGVAVTDVGGAKTTVTINAGGDAVVATGISQFPAAGDASADLRSILSDEVGTGAAYFVGGALGTPASGNGSNLTNLNVSSASGTLPVANGGTGLTAGTSGGVLAYTAAGTLASSGALAAGAVVLGGGAGAAPTALAVTTLGSVVMGDGAGAPVAGTFTCSGNVSCTPTVGTMTIDVKAGPAFTGTASADVIQANEAVAAPGNLMGFKDNDLNTFNTTCADSGTAGEIKFIDADKTSADDWQACNGITSMGSVNAQTQCKTFTTFGTTDDHNLFRANTAITIRSINCITRGSASPTVTLLVQNRGTNGAGSTGVDGATTIVCDSDNQADDGSLSAPTGTAGQWFGIDISANGGTPTELTVCVDYAPF